MDIVVDEFSKGWAAVPAIDRGAHVVQRSARRSQIGARIAPPHAPDRAELVVRAHVATRQTGEGSHRARG